MTNALVDGEGKGERSLVAWGERVSLWLTSLCRNRIQVCLNHQIDIDAFYLGRKIIGSR